VNPAAHSEPAAKRAAAASLALGVVAISFAAILFRKAAPTHPLLMAAVRLAVAAVVLAPVTLRAWRRGRLPSRILGPALGAGVLYALHFGTWVSSLELTTVAASVTLVTATPLLLAVVAWVTGRDRPDRRHWGALLLAAVGVTLIGGFDLGTSPRALLGDVLAALGAAAMAGYLLLVRSRGAELDVWGFSGVACAVGAGCLLLAAAAAGLPIRVASSQSLGYLVLAALVPQVLGHGLLTWSLRHVRPTVVGMATVGEPVGSTLLAWLWLGEVVPPGVAAGCAVTLLAVVLSVWQPRH
jgi:drug/metabolite transporter (DMT)-like permease